MPSTNRSPLILTTPVLSPTAAGSRTRFDGPVIVAVVLDPFEMDTPIAVVSNLVFPSYPNDTDELATKLLAVSAVDTFTVSSSE